MSTFSQLRTQARSLETEFEGLLSTYSSFTQSISGSAMEDENRTVKSIEESLSKVSFMPAIIPQLVIN